VVVGLILGAQIKANKTFPAIGYSQLTIQQIPIKSQVGGTIKAINFEEGNFLNLGQVLVQLESNKIDQKITFQAHKLIQNHQRLTDLRRLLSTSTPQVGRIEATFKGPLQKEQALQVNTPASGLVQEIQNLTSRNQTLERSNRQLLIEKERYAILSPISGVIRYSKKWQTGDVVLPNQVIAWVPKKEFRIVFQMNEYEKNHLKIASTVSFQTMVKKQSFQGQIEDIRLEEGHYLVTCEVMEQAINISPGIKIKGRFQTDGPTIKERWAPYFKP
jgi:multidrug efflux pump subunit AcrA (membrane-fusion protein)